MNASKVEKFGSILIAISSVIISMVLLWSVHDYFGKFTDFPEYYAAAKMILVGKGESVYALNEMVHTQQNLFPALGKRFTPIYLPPPSLILFIPIALIGLPLAVYVWKLLLITCLAGSIILLVRTFSLNYKSTCYLIAGLTLCHASFEMLRIDQIGAILLLALSAALYFLQKNKDIKAGLSLSLMIMKPQFVLPFLVYLIGLQRWRPVTIFFIVGIVLTACSYLIMGQTGFSNYFALLRAPESASFMQPELMPTLRGQLLRICPNLSNVIFYVAALVFAAVTYCSWFCGDDNRQNAKAVLWAFLVTIPLTFITSLHCHSYDLLLLAPSIIIIFTDAVIRFSQSFKLIMIIGGLVFMIPIAIFIHYFYLLQGGPINIWFIELLIMESSIITRLIRLK